MNIGQILFATLIAFGQEPPAQKALNTLRAAHELWLAEVTISCRFELTHGYAPTEDAALRGEIDLSIPDKSQRPFRNFRAAGRFCKLGPKWRYALDFGGPAIPVGRDALGSAADLVVGSNFVANKTFDEVSDDRLELRFHPADSSVRASLISITARAEGRRGHPFAGAFAQDYLNPLAPLGNQLLAQAGRSDDESTVSVRKLGVDRQEVIIEATGTGALEGRIVFWLEPSPPVVEKIVQQVKGSPGGTKIVAQLSDFRQCGGGMVASKVVLMLTQPGQLPWVKCWQSPDLGDRMPTDRDFVIEAPAGTFVVGLKHPPRRDQPHDYDVSKIAETELLAPGSPAPTQQPPPDATVSWSWAWIANGALVAVVVLGLVLRRVWKRKSPASGASAP